LIFQILLAFLLSAHWGFKSFSMIWKWVGIWVLMVLGQMVYMNTADGY